MTDHRNAGGAFHGPERVGRGLAIAMMVAVYATFLYTIVEATLLS